MTARSVLARGRRAAEALMVDTCVIRRKVGPTVDPDTGAEVPIYTEVYSGKCRVQSRNFATESPNAAGQRVDLYHLEVQVPMSVVGVAVNDEVEITSSVHDPDLVGRRMRVQNLFHASHKTARRLQVEEVTS